MIYFLTDWQSEMEQLELNGIFNVTKIFNTSGIDTKIINTKILHFSNYFANKFGFYNSNNLVNLLDTVSHQFASNHAPLNMSDLQIPNDWEKTFTRKNVLFSKNGSVKGEVYFNQFGFVSEVHYYSLLGKEIHKYSEKGHILCKQKIDSSGEQIENQVFDEGGQVIFTEWSDYVFIGETYKKYFTRETYTSFKDVCIDLLNTILKDFDSDQDRIVIGGSSWLMDIVEGFLFPESIIYVFSGELQFCINQIDKHLSLIERGKGIITDNLLFQEKIENENLYQSLKSKVHFMPLTPTSLTLGESNTYQEQYVYWQIEQFDSQIEEILLDFLRMKLVISDLCLIIDSRNHLNEEKVLKIVESFVEQNFGVSVTSPDYELVKQYYKALENEEMTPPLRELFNTAKRERLEFSNTIESYLFFVGTTFRNHSNAQTLKEDLTKVRIFIDQREKDEFFSHSLAVSAGIPIISKRPSPYLIENKNGIVFQIKEQLIQSVGSYLSNTDKWNQNLVESVEVIEKYSMDGLITKWKEYLK